MICDLRIGAASLAGTLVLLALLGCGKKEREPAAPEAVGPGAAEIAAARDALTRGMQRVGVDKLTTAHVGRRCVVAARSALIPPPPPPLGMVRIMGSTTFYMGQLSDISPEAVKIGAAYPTSGNRKYVDIARGDIQSIHLSD
jgi:hypothetical protein